MENQLSERKHKILIQAIEDYIKDANPITSGGVREKILKDVSTATLRNELNALEAMGYLKQLHTSSGRVPTAKGYKYYVSGLLVDMDFTSSQLEKVREDIESRSNTISDVMTNLAKIVSKVTNYPTVVFIEGVSKLVVQDIRIIPLIEKQALLLIKTKSGYINNTINGQMSEKGCLDASRYLSKIFKDKTIEYMMENIDEIEKSCKEQIEGFKIIVDNIIRGMRAIIEKPLLDIRREGASQLLNAEGSEKATKIFDFLDDEEGLASAMHIEDNEKDLSFTFAEDGDKMEGCALVKAPIVVEGQTVASIGVVGPHRMDYSNIASALKLVMSELDKTKSEGENDEKEKR